MEVEIGDRVFQLEKPSGYRLLKAVSREKDEADMMRDLILICVKEPQLTAEEVENMDSETFFTLSAKINELLSDDVKKLTQIQSSEK